MPAAHSLCTGLTQGSGQCWARTAPTPVCASTRLSPAPAGLSVVGSDPWDMVPPCLPLPRCVDATHCRLAPLCCACAGTRLALPRSGSNHQTIGKPNQKNQHQLTTILLSFALVQHHHPASNRQGSLLPVPQHSAGCAREMHCR